MERAPRLISFHGHGSCDRQAQASQSPADTRCNGGFGLQADAPRKLGGRFAGGEIPDANIDNNQPELS